MSRNIINKKSRIWCILFCYFALYLDVNAVLNGCQAFFYHINLFKQQNNDNKFCTSQNNWQSARSRIKISVKAQDLHYKTELTFFLKVADLFNAKFNCAFSPTSHEILFGTNLNTSRNNELKLNYCLLFAKYYYLYYQRVYHKACNITEFMLKLEQKLLNIESRPKRKFFVWKCFCPLTRLLSDLVFLYCTLYFIF